MWEYRGIVFSKEESEEYYQVLKGLTKTTQDTITVFKPVLEPRFKQFFSKSGEGYEYSHADNESAGWPEVIEKLAKKAQELVGCDIEFDSALVNYYPDGKYYVGSHRDDDAMEGHIASFSFGATRRFHIRDAKSKKILKTFDLENGSLFIMNPGMQYEHKHELPKMLKVKEGRVNITFRQHANLNKSKRRKVDE